LKVCCLVNIFNGSAKRLIAATEELSCSVLLDSYNIFNALKYIICIAKNVNDAVYKTVVNGITFKIEKHITPMPITNNEIKALFLRG
jgi:bacterioferritin (cytochrome b1)